ATATSPRAQADLTHIVATDPQAVHHPAEPPRPARTGRRILVAAGAAAVLAVGLVALPPLTGGDQAFATWTAAPTEIVAAGEVADAAASCRDQLAGGAGADHEAALGSAAVAVAEQRGAWTTVLLAGAGGFSALCITD